MAIDARQVRHIAELCRLDLDEAAVETFRHQLQAILDYVAMLDTLAVEQVPPTANPLATGSPMRDDDVRPGLTVEQALANAPDAAASQFRVPRVIKG